MPRGDSRADGWAPQQHALNVEERRRFGLDWSDAAIRAARDHPNSCTTRLGGATCWWTPEERALLDEKVAASLEADLNTSQLVGDALRHFAGAVPDPSLPLGGWLVGFTESEDVYVDLLRPGFRYPDRLVSFRAAHSLADLQRVADDVARSGGEIRSQGLEPSGAEIDIKRNVVVVGADGVSGEGALVEGWLKGRFGPVELLANVYLGTAAL